MAGANNYPAAESPAQAINNDTSAGSKYLNFAKTGVGFIVTSPAHGPQTVVTGLHFFTANDAPERDPLTVTIEGTNSANATTTLNSTWTTIYNGVTGLATDPGRSASGAVVTFSNSLAFSSYRVLASTVRTAGTANSMQFGEVELIGSTFVKALVVDTTSDSAALNACTAAANDCSLRGAIAAAASGDTITFSSLFNSPQTITLGGTELLINKNLTVNGPGANLLTVSGNNQSRVFEINGATATLSGMTITGGNGVGSTASGLGGGLLSFVGQVTLMNCHVTGNTASFQGGGVLASAGNNTSLSVLGSTIANNSSASGAGGIFSSSSTLIVTNSTISGNMAGGSINAGGGISASGAATITNSTITNNTGNGSNIAGGLLADGTVVTVRNSIVAANVNNPTVPDVGTASGGTFVSSGYNLIGNRGSVAFGGTGDQSRTGGAPLNPLLGALANNGGPTLTHALLGGSRALDRGSNNGSGTDQRGSTRTVDLGIPNAVGGDGTDIGAYEAAAIPPCSLSSTPIAVGGTANGTLAFGDCNFDGGSYYDAYTFNGTAGQQIAISMNSSAFNAFLYLYQGNYPGGTVIAIDDNGGSGNNARIPATSGFFALPATGTYTILAISLFVGETGAYKLNLILPDTTAPTASASPTGVTTAGATSYAFPVFYTDDVAINVSTIDTSDVRITGPNGFNVSPSTAGLNNNANGTPRIATYTFTQHGGSWDAGDNGTYNVVMQASQVADTSGNFVAAGNIGSFTVNIAVTATHFSVTARANATSGTPFNFTVNALDASNAIVPGYRGTVHVTTSAASATLPANFTFTAGDQGTHQFSATLSSVGGQTITATDTLTASITGTSGTITVASPVAPATHFSISAPANATSGTVFNFIVTAVDASNATTSGYTGIVHFTSSDGSATLPANYTFTAGDGGVHSFSATLIIAGIQTITATDTLTASITGTSGTIAVAAGAATRFGLGVPQSGVTSGVAFNVNVIALDSNSQFATGYRGTVHFTSTSGGTFPADYAFTAADNGVHTFSFTLTTLGNQTITATDTGNAAINGTSPTINVSAPAPQTFIVTNLNDSGTGSLRQAILNANANSPAADTINFQAGLSGTITLTSGQLSISDSVTINGPGASTIAVSGNNASRVFETNGGTTVSISGLTVRNGSVTGDGGGIRAFGTMSLSNCAVTNNTATGFSGGIDTNVSLTITNCTIAGNTAANGGGMSSAGTINIVGSTFTGNSATFQGGGINAQGGNGTIINSTITGNTANSNSLSGSAVYFASFGGSFSLQVTNCTVANNVTGTANTGGGILVGANGASATATAVLKNNIIANNAAPNLRTFPEAGGTATITSQGFNLTSDPTNVFLNQPADQFNTNPLLGPLANNGGPTQTHALLFGSPALDKGSNSGSGTDQRGLTRTVDLPSIGNASGDGTDIGAYEAQTAPAGAPATSFSISSPASATGGTAFNFIVTAIDATSSQAQGYTGTVHFTSTDGGATLPADYTFTANDSGAHQFSATLVTAGNRTITATDALNSINGISGPINVTGSILTTATVSGKVFTASGGGLGGATVSITDPQGNRVTVRTNNFGSYTFNGVATGQSYIVSVASKRFRFANQNLPVNGDLANINFTGLE